MPSVGLYEAPTMPVMSSSGTIVERLPRIEHAGRHAAAVLQRDVLLEPRDLLGVAREEQVAALAEPHVDAEIDGEAPAQLDRLLHQPDVELGGPLLAHAAAVAARGALGEVAALDDDHVLEAALGEVVRDRQADHAAADDHDLGGRGQGPGALERRREPNLAGDIAREVSSSSSITGCISLAPGAGS